MKTTVSALALAMCCGLAASAAGPDVIYTEVATAPASKRAVPGIPGATWLNFNSPFASPSGQYWVMGAQAAGVATTADFFVLWGSGTTGQVTAREGDVPPFNAAGTYGFFDEIVSVNDNGDFVFCNDLNPTTLTANDEVMVRYNNVGGTPAFASAPLVEGEPYPGAGVDPLAPAGTRVGTNINSPAIFSDGGIGAQVDLFVDAAVTPPITANNNDAILRRTQTLAREASTVFTGGSFALDDLVNATTRFSADGSSWMTVGDDENPTTTADRYCVVNGAVVLREGAPVGSLTGVMAAASPSEVAMAPNGDWFAQGSQAGAAPATDWVVRNGVVLASTEAGVADAIAAGSTEKWSEATFAATFFFFTGNGRGDYVIGGTTDAADVNAAAVLVLNGQTVLAREGDPLDVDGNGLFDDNTFIRTFSNYEGFLTDDGWLYFNVSTTQVAGAGGSGADTGDAFVRLRAFTPGCYANCDGSTSVPQLNALDFSCFLARYRAGESYANCDGSTSVPALNALDFGCFLARYRAGCP